MKNLLLFSIVVALAVFTFFFEEMGGKKRADEEERLRSILSPSVLGELLEFKTPSVHLVKKSGIFYVADKDYPADEVAFDEVMKHLQALKVRRYLKQEEIDKSKENLFFSDPSLQFSFRFKNSQVAYQLGNPLEFSGDFYLKVIKDNQENWLVVYDDGILEGVYDKTQESKLKYQRVQSILFLDSELFLSRAIFPQSIQVRSIEVDSRRNKKFKLDFHEQRTYPGPPNGILVDSVALKTQETFLNKLRAYNVFLKGDKTKLKRKFITLELLDSKGAKVSLQLFKKYDDKMGDFLVTPASPTIFELSSNQAERLFLNVQDFWIKKFFSDSSLLKKDKLNFEVSFQKRGNFSLQIPKSERFEVVNLGGGETPQHDSFYELFNFLNKEAAYMKVLDPEDVSHRNDYFIRILLDGQLLYLQQTAKETIIVNETNGYKLHHLIEGELPVKLEYQDYFL